MNFISRFKKNMLSFFLFSFLIVVFEANAAKTMIPGVKLKAATTPTSSQGSASMALTPFTKTEISKSPVTDLSQFLKQNQSGVQLINSSGDVSQTALAIRGFGDNAVANALLLIDGFPMTNPSLFAPNFNAIPLADIERIDIFQGSQGSRWGDQAVGGVLSITTKHPKSFFANALVNWGSFQNQGNTVLVGDRKENGFFYKLFALIAQTDHYREHNQQQSNNLSAQVGMDYANGSIRLNVQSYSDRLDFPGGLTEAQWRHDPKQAVEWTNFSGYRTTLLQALTKQAINDHWLIETRADYHTTEGEGYVFLNFNRRDQVLSLQPQLKGSFNKHQWIFGYTTQLSQYALINQRLNARATAQQQALFIETNTQLADRWEMTLGARKAWQNNVILSVNPRRHAIAQQVFVSEQGLTFHPMPALSFFIRRDGNFSFPKANEQTWLPQSVAYLHAQTGTSYETGVTLQTARQRLQLSVYQLQLNHEIAFNPQQTVDQPFGAFNNLDRTLRQGLSLSEQVQLTTKLKLSSQFNMVKARLASGLHAGSVIPAVAAFSSNVGANYAFNDMWSVQYTWLYVGTKYPSEDVNNEAKKVPAYALNDLALQYFYHQFMFNFELRNLFNVNYTNYVYYDSYRQANVYYPAVGRNIAMSLKINID